eukprot:352204-Amorphochlora_amoeboformis.AAC.2
MFRSSCRIVAARRSRQRGRPPRQRTKAKCSLRSGLARSSMSISSRIAVAAKIAVTATTMNTDERERVGEQDGENIGNCRWKA